MQLKLKYMNCWSFVFMAVFGFSLVHGSNRPGVVTPIKVEVEIGATFNITCVVNKERGSSEDIYFEEKNSSQISKNPVIILDKQTAVLTFHNASEQVEVYRCMVGENAIGATEVYVGKRPQPVTDFTCRNYDYMNITCSFNKPHNNILTNYNLSYTLDNTGSLKYYMESCEPKDSSVYCCYRSKMVPKREFYNFTLESNNTLGINIEHFSLDLYKNVVPEKLYVEVRNITDKSAILKWNQFQTEFYKQMGLEYEILLRYDGRDWYQYKIFQWNTFLNVEVQINLPYAYYKYDFKVHARVAKRPNNDVIPSICFDDNIFNANNMWSKSFEGKIKTKSRIPDFAPKTSIGSFYIGQSTTQIYWHNMEEYEKNGANFHYTVNELDPYSSNKAVHQWNTTSSSIILRTTDSRIYSVSASNEIGESNDKAIIRVFETESLSKPSNVASVYHNDSYTLTWTAPNKLPTNYTVFWCLSAREQQDKCQGTINFVQVNNSVTNFTTVPQKVSLNLAVSANYPNYSSGMIWSKCAADILSDLTELSAEIREKSSDHILLQWSLDNVCISIIKGINITYCQLSNDNTIDNCANTTLSGQVIHNFYNITNLKPYTNYAISIRMYSQTKEGPITKLTERTNESAPTAPRDLEIHNNSITSKSVNISWLPPLESNGHIKYYTICFRKIRSTVDEHRDIPCENMTATNHDRDHRINFTLGSLNSYTEYEANVKAYTVDFSTESNNVRFKTLIGVPTQPVSVTIVNKDTISEIRWKSPKMPSGRVEFYVVSMITQYNNSFSGIEELYLVNANSCEFYTPPCSTTWRMKVRAVNIAAKDEIDTNTFPITRNARHSRETNPAIKSYVAGNVQTFDITTAKPEKYSKPQTTIPATKFECLNSNYIDKRSASYVDTLNAVDKIYGTDEYIFIRSTWQNGILLEATGCTPAQNIKYKVIYIFVSIVFGLGLILAFFMIYKKCIKWNNIKPILPQGLEDHIPNSNFGCEKGVISYDSKIDKNTLQISGSNDCLVPKFHKENRCLLDRQFSESLTSLTPNSNKTSNYEQLETPSLPSKNSDLNSHSSDSVDINDINKITYQCQSSGNSSMNSSEYQQMPDWQLNSESTNDIKQPTIEAFKEPSLIPNGYVRPNTILMFQDTAKQFQQQNPIPQQLPTDGYTTLEALEKYAPDISNEDSMIINQSSYVPLAALQENVETTNEANKIPGVQYNNNNSYNYSSNNNNAIGGYVTPTQLANMAKLQTKPLG